MKIAAIDPGKTGGICLLDTASEQLEFRPLPLSPLNKWDPCLMWQEVRTWHSRGVRRVVIEECHAFPGPQAFASSVVMFGYGMWLGTLHSNGFAPWTPRAETWKKDMDLLVPIVKAGKKATEKEKKAAYAARKLKAVEKAETIFNTSFRGPKGALLDGKAEAALLAVWLTLHGGKEANSGY